MGIASPNILRWSSGYLAELPAENIAVEMAEYEMQRHQTRRKSEGLFLSSWNHVEYAMNRSHTEKDVRDSYFDLTQNLIQKILLDPKAHQDTQLGALILSTYMPLFRKRADAESINASDCDEIYASIGQAMTYIKPLAVEEPPQWEMMEAAVLALSARSGQPNLLLYPASPREERSPHAWSNHDSYFFTGTDKIPVQQKLIRTDKDYSDWITVLTLEPIVEKAFKRSGLESDLASHKMNYVLSLIVAESLNHELDEQEIRFMNHLTRAVVSHRRVGEPKPGKRITVAA